MIGPIREMAVHPQAGRGNGAHGAADRVCQRRQSADGAPQGGEKSRCSIGAWCNAMAIDSSVADRERAAVARRRNCRVDLAYWINQLLMAFKPPFPPPFTFALDLSFDIRTFTFTFLLAIATG
jgi:hypothetical protein